MYQFAYTHIIMSLINLQICNKSYNMLLLYKISTSISIRNMPNKNRWISPLET